jgi:hypothetical protein
VIKKTVSSGGSGIFGSGGIGFPGGNSSARTIGTRGASAATDRFNKMHSVKKYDLTKAIHKILHG